MFGAMDGIFGSGDRASSLIDRHFEIAGSIDGFGIAMIVLGILLWAAVMTALVLVIMELLRRRKQSPAGLGYTGQGVAAGNSTPDQGGVVTADSEALKILHERYARGEIGHEEYLQRKNDLTDS
jgi:uncharacterized membrane protein